MEKGAPLVIILLLWKGKYSTHTPPIHSLTQIPHHQHYGQGLILGCLWKEGASPTELPVDWLAFRVTG